MMIDKNCRDLMDTFLDIQEKIVKNDNVVQTEIEIKKMIAIEIMCNIILSKKIFRKNSDLGDFLRIFFGILVSKSMLSSRTLVCGKVMRLINSITLEEEINNLLNQLYTLLKRIKKDEDIYIKDIYDVIKDMEI